MPAPRREGTASLDQSWKPTRTRPPRWSVSSSCTTPGHGSTRRSARSPARTTRTCGSCSWSSATPAPEVLDAVTARIRSYLPAAFIRAIAGNPGYGPAVNEVLRLVEGDNGFFLLCHDDIAPAADAVRTMVTELYRSNAGMVGPKLVEWDEPRRLQHVGLGLDRFGEVDPIVEPGEVDQEQHDAVRDVFVLPSACVLVRADLLRELRGFDPAVSFHGDDVDLCWRAHLHGARGSSWRPTPGSGTSNCSRSGARI